MQLIKELLDVAKQRAASKSLPYAGELSPQEAFAILQQDRNAVLIDVRSQAELDLVGRVPSAIHIEWAFYPGMVANADFAAQLQSQINQDKTIIFMCRTGGRSHNAALVAQQLGYSQAYNMTEGFEGQANALKQRTLINGWKHANLPWTN
jgi:rhodanese-related sulfurtransferase